MDAAGAKPVPVPDEWSAGYWAAAREGRLVVQRCDACGQAQYPPDVTCHRCHADALGFDDVEGRGVVYSFSTFHRSLMPVFEAPYVLALVDLEGPGVRMLTNLVDVDPGEVSIGMPVEVTFEQRGDWSIPQFRPQEAAR